MLSFHQFELQENSEKYNVHTRPDAQGHHSSTKTNNDNWYKHLTRPVNKAMYLSSVLSDTLPQWLEHTVKWLNTIWGGSFSQSGQSKSSDGPDFLLLIHQTYKDKAKGMNKAVLQHSFGSKRNLIHCSTKPTAAMLDHVVENWTLQQHHQPASLLRSC